MLLGKHMLTSFSYWYMHFSKAQFVHKVHQTLPFFAEVSLA